MAINPPSTGEKRSSTFSLEELMQVDALGDTPLHLLLRSRLPDTTVKEFLDRCPVFTNELLMQRDLLGFSTLQSALQNFTAQQLAWFFEKCPKLTEEVINQKEIGGFTTSQFRAGVNLQAVGAFYPSVFVEHGHVEPLLT